MPSLLPSHPRARLLIPILVALVPLWVVHLGSLWNGHQAALLAGGLLLLAALTPNRWLGAFFAYVTFWSLYSLVRASLGTPTPEELRAHGAVYEFAGWCLTGGVVYVACLHLRPKVRALALAMLAGALIQLLVWMLQSMGWDPVWELLHALSPLYAQKPHLRPHLLGGTLANPNLLAAWLTLCLPWVWLVGRRRTWLWLTLAVSLLALSAWQACTTSLVAGLAGLALLSWLGRERPALALLALALPCGLAWVLVYDGGWYELLGRLTGEGYGARLLSWQATLSAWWQGHPWLGAGPGAWTQDWPVFRGPTMWWTWKHAHNELIELLYEGGLLGLALVGGYVVSLARRLPPAPRRPEVIALAAFLAIAFVLCLGLFMMHLAALALPVLVSLALWEMETTPEDPATSSD